MMKSPTPPKPAQPARTKTLLDRLEPAQSKVLLVGLLAFFLLSASTTLLLAYYIYEPEITSWLKRPTSIFKPTPISQSVLPTQMIILTSTPSCSGSSLQLGALSWRLEPIQRLADGSVNVPADTPGVAYWIDNLENNDVFGLSPTPDNLELLGGLQGGEEGVITWENCNSVTYILSAPQNIEPGSEIHVDDSTSPLFVYVRPSDTAAGVKVRGTMAGETITSPGTYAPEPSEVNAEISLLETTSSQDGATIQVVVSILNYGIGAINLSESDITLTPESEASLALTNSNPTLPENIKPGESKTITLVFPRPASGTAILKIFTVVYDLDNY